MEVAGLAVLVGYVVHLAVAPRTLLHAFGSGLLCGVGTTLFVVGVMT